MRRIARIPITFLILITLLTAQTAAVPLPSPASSQGSGPAVSFVRTPTDTFAWQAQNPEHVFTDLQAAIEHVFESGGGQVRVAKGVYSPAEEGEHFSLRNGVVVTGGFSGDEEGDIPVWRNNAAAERQTILRPNGAHIFRHVEEDALGSTAVLENVTLTGARDHSAVSNAGAHPGFINVIFADNEAPHGAAMNNFFSDPAVIESVFRGNTAQQGGGAMFNLSSSPTVRDSEFVFNTSRGAGGAVLSNSSRPTFTGTAFSDNEAEHDGGAFAAVGDSHVLFHNSRFSRNKSKRYGGALSAEGGILSLFNANFSGNIGLFGGAKYLSHAYSNSVNASFYGNTAKHGGAAYADNAEIGYINAYFFRNSADSNGGAVYGNLTKFNTLNSHFLENRAGGGGGGLYNSGGSLLSVNSLFVQNSSGSDGGGLFSESAASADSRLEMINSTVADNSSRTGSGGGVASSDYFVAVRNSIISGNRSSTGSRDLAAREVNPAQASSSILRNTIVDSRFYDREGNAQEAAFDVDTHLDRDFRPVGEGNPAVGAGDNAVFNEVFSNINLQFGAGRTLRPYDLHGGERIAGESGVIDLGALQSSVAAADISPPSPTVSARTAMGDAATAGRVASSVYLLAHVDVTALDNFPLVRRNGFLPFEIYVEDKYGQELYSGLKIEYNSGEYNFWSSLAGAADSARIPVVLEIERSGPRVTTVSFGEGVDFSAVPISLQRVEITFASDVRGSGQSTRVRLFAIESEGDGREREMELANLSESFVILGNRLIVDITDAKLRYGTKYRLQVEGLVDTLNNQMDVFSTDFVTRVSPEVYQPTITGLLTSARMMPSDGGFADVTVAGGNLGSFEEILVTFNDLSGRAVVSDCGTSALASGIFIPPNSSDHPVQYTFGVLGDGVDHRKQLTITVEGQVVRAPGAAAGEPVFSGTSPRQELFAANSLDMIANGLPVRLDDFNLMETHYVTSVNSIGGEATVVIAYEELERLKAVNPHFRLGIASPLGVVMIPVDTSGIIGGMRSLIQDSGMEASDIYLRYRLEDVSHDESLTEGVRENFSFDGPLSRLSLEVVGNNGKILKNVSSFAGNMRLLLPVPVGGVISPYSSVYMIDAGGSEPTFVPNTIVEENGTRYISVRAPGSGAFFVGESLVDFADITTYSTYREMRQAAALGIIRGMGDGNFEPTRLVTRGEFLQMASNALNLGKSSQEAPFADVSRYDWYSDSIASMYEAGLLTAFAGNALGPERPITREEVAGIVGAILTRSPSAPVDFAPLRTMTPGENFRDSADIATPFQRDAMLVTRLGIMSGRHDVFQPKGMLTREDAAVALIRMMRVIGYVM
ncbi:MAG: S-layer homology domain-containing protein [Defluviitaleaceae bacterium]|nr:S-layer homology domain-containing protein [Defluviitaleaceae bacterium]